MQTNAAIKHSTTTKEQPLKHPAPFPRLVVSHAAPDRRPSPFLLAMDCLRSAQLTPAAFAMGKFMAHHARYATEDDRRRKVQVGEIFCFWTQAKLATKLKKSVSQVERHMRALRKAGLKVRRRVRPYGASYVFIPIVAAAASFQEKKESQSVRQVALSPVPSNLHKTIDMNRHDAGSGAGSDAGSDAGSHREKSIANKEKRELLINYETIRQSLNQSYEQSFEEAREASNPPKPEPQETPTPKPPNECARQVKVKIDPEILKQAQAQKARVDAARSRLGIVAQQKDFS